MDPQKNQNQISGTLRTLQTDISGDPQDRLQQAGNFVQARPEVVVSTSAPQNPTNQSVTGATPDPNTVNPNTEKKDIPEVNTTDKPTYSWTNSSPEISSENKPPISVDMQKTPVSPSNTPNSATTKPSLSVLDDSIDFTNATTPASLSVTPSTLNSSATMQSTGAKPDLGSLPTPEQQVYSSFNTGDNFSLEDKLEDKPEDKPKRKPIKKTGIIVGLLILLIGVGVYIYTTNSFNLATILNFSSSPNTNTTPDTAQPTEPDTVRGTPFVVTPEIISIDISQDSNETIRNNILLILNREGGTVKSELTELLLVKGENQPKLSLEEFAQIFGFNLSPEIVDKAKDYWIYVYNQQGIYKLASVIELFDDSTAQTLVTNWGSSIPRDMAPFSLSSPSRIVNAAPELKTSTFVNSKGETFVNNYYNYTSNTDSIDVSTTSNYIILSSSQDAMGYITGQE
jgi:hypothetical protein